MNAYQHVLAATDLSEQSAVIVERAAEVARRNGARLSLIHVSRFLPSFELGGELALPPYPDIEQALVSAARARLAVLAKRFEIDEYDTHAIIGTPRLDILRFAREHAVDLIVVGRHARHGFGLLVGSTASGILNGATCDVLAVTV